MSAVYEILDILSNHPYLSRLLVDGSVLGGTSLVLYRAEKSRHLLSRLADYIGGKLTVSVKEWVKETNMSMENRLASKIDGIEHQIEDKISLLEIQIDERIDKVYEKVESNHEESLKKDLYGKADFYHDEILLQADKMRGGKIPTEERARQLYHKVKWYHNFVENHDDYQNGVCDLACDYITSWFEKNYKK